MQQAEENKHSWIDVFLKNAKEEPTSFGKFYSWLIVVLIFIDIGTFGLIDEKSIKVFRSVTISDILFWFIILFSLTRFKEIKYILYKNVCYKIILVLVSFVTLELIFSSFEYGFSIFEYFFRIINVYKILIVLPMLVIIHHNSFTYLFKRIFTIALILSIFYMLNALFDIELFKGYYSIMQDIGGVTVKRVYANTLGSDIFFLYLLYKVIIDKKLPYYQYVFMTIMILPTILSFGRNSWMVLLMSSIILSFIIFIKNRNVINFLKYVISIAVVIFLFANLIIVIYPKSENLFYAISERIFEGKENYQYNEGTYGFREKVQIPALITLWESAPIFGIGVHDFWAKGSQEFYSTAFSDVNWPGILAAYGIVGIILFSIFTMINLKTSYYVVKNSDNSSLLFFLNFVVFSSILTSLSNTTNIFSLSIFLSGSYISSIVWVFPIIGSYVLKAQMKDVLPEG